MAITEIYVDPAGAADAGSGTIGDPFLDLEYAIVQSTFDTTNGTRINIKAGTDEVLVASLQTALADTSVSVAWVSAEAAPLVFQGYTASAGDGGVGGISGGGSVGVLTDAVLDYVCFVDLHLHNTGSERVLDVDNNCSIIRCEVNNTTGLCIAGDSATYISRCYLHDGNGCVSIAGGIVRHCYVVNATAAAAINVSGGTAYRNLIKVDTGGHDAIVCGQSSTIQQNSIYAVASDGGGINPSSNQVPMDISNNLIQGFSATGGQGIQLGNTLTGVFGEYSGNAVYDCETAYGTPTRYVTVSEDNETLTASPFTDAAGGDFSPVDVGSVKEGALPEDFGNGSI